MNDTEHAEQAYEEVRTLALDLGKGYDTLHDVVEHLLITHERAMLQTPYAELWQDTRQRYDEVTRLLSEERMNRIAQEVKR